jgi:hypothetical protein
MARRKKIVDAPKNEFITPVGDFRVHCIFGASQVQEFHNIYTKQLGSGTDLAPHDKLRMLSLIKLRLFKTQAEADAYLLGVGDTSGYTKVRPIMENDCAYLRNELGLDLTRITPSTAPITPEQYH